MSLYFSLHFRFAGKDLFGLRQKGKGVTFPVTSFTTENEMLQNRYRTEVLLFHPSLTRAKYNIVERSKTLQVLYFHYTVKLYISGTSAT